LDAVVYGGFMPEVNCMKRSVGDRLMFGTHRACFYGSVTEVEPDGAFSVRLDDGSDWSFGPERDKRQSIVGNHDDYPMSPYHKRKAEAMNRGEY
jgi:hypothetical protein